MKVVLLCGGQGTRLREETELKPKPMVSIGGHPIVWHIMKTYAHYGYTDFVLCLGYKGEVIKDYFYNYQSRNSNFTIELGTNNINFHSNCEEKGWKVTLVDTGEHAMTGARVKRIEEFVDDDIFMLTYGDGVIDVDINELVKFHQSHGKIGTVTGVCPPSRYGELVIRDEHVVSFDEKPQNSQGSINGGYFVFNKEFFSYLNNEEGCILERDPLEKLSSDGQLKVYQHKGFWQCMDTYRDYTYLQNLIKDRKAPWIKW